MFEKIAKEIHNERVVRNHYDYNKRKVNGDNIYLDFCVWCNCQGQPELKTNARAFAEWLNRENITLTFWQRKWIAENHFGWQFTWNEEKKEWESRKV